MSIGDKSNLHELLDQKNIQLVGTHLRIAQQLLEQLQTLPEVELQEMIRMHVESAFKLLSADLSVSSSVSAGKEVTAPPTPAVSRRVESPPPQPSEPLRAPRTAEPKPSSSKNPTTPPQGKQRAVRIADAFERKPVRNEGLPIVETRAASPRLVAVAHLTKAMTLNDRLRFTSELFHGDRQAFEAAVSTIEAAQSLPDALSALQKCYQGTPDNPTLKELIQLIERRFAK